MHAHGRRAGLLRSTPASVQCQKCLKRDMFAAIPNSNINLTPSPRHYSYECKASAQDRPYVPRPSRSQQLRNPKLIPKLTNDALQPLEKKKGVADEEIAKRETLRAQKREREEREDAMIRSPRRPRSVSSSSISTISTGASANVNQSRGRVELSSPSGYERDRQAATGDGRQPRGHGHSRSFSRSPPPPRGRRRPSSRDSRSPPPDSSRRRYRSRDKSSARGDQDDRGYRPRPKPQPYDLRDDDVPESRRHRYTHSPETGPARRDERAHGCLRRGRDDGARDNNDDRCPKGAETDEPPRERSLSPFSRRLAMTRGLDLGR